MTIDHLENTITYPANSIMINGKAILICGHSGVGKSALTLSMIDRGAEFISDDQTMIMVENGRVFVTPHPNIINKIEVRNVGIIDLPAYQEPVALSLKVILTDKAPRFRDDADQETILGCQIPAISLHPDLATAPIKLEYALQRFGIGA